MSPSFKEVAHKPGYSVTSPKQGAQLLSILWYIFMHVCVHAYLCVQFQQRVRKHLCQLAYKGSDECFRSSPLRLSTLVPLFLLTPFLLLPFVWGTKNLFLFLLWAVLVFTLGPFHCCLPHLKQSARTSPGKPLYSIHRLYQVPMTQYTIDLCSVTDLSGWYRFVCFLF